MQRAIKSYADDGAHELRLVDLSQSEVNLYYNGFSNEILWPLFHDFIWLCNFDPDYWPAYLAVNEKFADAICHRLLPEDIIWVHDYHLLLVAAKLRERKVRNKVGFFLHIPFPSVDGFMKIPWRTELMDALLCYDLIGFQTEHDMHNFVSCAQSLITELSMQDAGKQVRLKLHDRDILVGAFSISIDYDGFTKRSRDEDVMKQAAAIRSHMGEQQLVLGIDRLDYTKGIPRRLNAFAEVLTAYPELRRRITFLQVIIPSRTDVMRYQTLKEDIERLIGEINGRFTQPGWTPIQYMHRGLCETELLAYYRTADIALITPLKDGMNLVAKEYCAANADKQGVLILSEFAGAAAQLSSDAIVVNPFDKKMTAEAIYRAFCMESHERARRMKNLRRAIHQDNVFKWADSFLAALSGSTTSDAITTSTPAIHTPT